MNENRLFLLIAILILLITFGLIFYARSKREETKALTPLTSLAFGFIISGIVFGEARWLGYGMIGLGVVLSILDAVMKLRNRG